MGRFASEKLRTIKMEENQNQKTLDIIQGISQAVARSYDGSLDEKNKPIEIGLRREENTGMFQHRLLDGFGVRIVGNKLILRYTSEIKLKEVHEKGFENDIVDKINQCIAFLKKEYKRVTKKSLSLKDAGEPRLNVEYMNHVRCWVTADQTFTIGGIDKPEELGTTVEERLSANVKKWLNLGKNDNGYSGLEK